MIVVGWLCDRSDTVGGAELTQQAFRDAAPDGITVVDCPPEGGWPQVDLFVVQNCTQYDPDVTYALEASGVPVVKYHHDVGPHVNPRLMSYFRSDAENLFCSPLQRQTMEQRLGPFAGGQLCPPAMDLQRFRDARQEQRHGTVWLGNMLNHGKGLRLAVEWAERNGPVRFYGDGPLRPSGHNVNDWGPISYDEVPALLGRSEQLLFLPTAIEPFGRVIAEAWAAGCEIVTNELVGAKWWIDEAPDALGEGATEFWDIIAGELAE